MDSSTTWSMAIKIYLGIALTTFVGAVTRDLIAPIVAGIFPGVEQGVDKITISIGPIKLKIGDAIGAALNLGVALLALSLVLPFIGTYSPIGGRR